MNNFQSKEKLNSWKEIAGYLDVSVRTAIRWEKQYGLPVHRIDNSVNARVFALKSDLDEWQLNRALDSRQHRKIHKNILILFILVPVLVIFVFLFFSLFSKKPNPFDFRIERSTLIALGEKGNILWDYDFKIENLSSNDSYHNNTNYKRKEGYTRQLPCIIIQDFDNNKLSEVLFGIKSPGEINEGEIFYFNHAGKREWSIELGKELSLGSHTYHKTYALKGFFTRDIDNDGDLEIFVISRHRDEHPTQLLVLDHEGTKIGEYWNAGRLIDYEFADLNRDGKEELLLVGVNNEYGKGVLIVFDVRNIEGASPQTRSDYKFEKSNFGSEIYYLLFPRTVVDLVAQPSKESINLIEIKDNREIFLTTYTSNINFVLNFDLKINEVRFSDSFRKKYSDFQFEGKIKKGKFDEKKAAEKLKSEILYFNGKEFAPNPSKVLHKNH